MVDDKTAFEWISQLRYYWTKNAEDKDPEELNCWVRMVQTDFPYGYEYRESLLNTTLMVSSRLTVPR